MFDLQVINTSASKIAALRLPNETVPRGDYRGYLPAACLLANLKQKHPRNKQKIPNVSWSTQTRVNRQQQMCKASLDQIFSWL